MLKALLFLVASAHATSWPDIDRPPDSTGPAASRDAALVIGIEDYAFAPDIPGARANAVAWMNWLTGSRGIPLVKPLLDQDATREEILVAAKQVAGSVKPGGTLWVVYIGHGAPSSDGKTGLLVGVDAQQTAASLSARGLPQSELQAAIRSTLPTSSETVIVIDACFSGRTEGGELVPGLAPFVPTSARVTSPRMRLLVGANSKEYAGPLSDGSRPAFSYLVLGALRGWGDDDGDGVITASEAINYANGAMLQTVTGRSQTAELVGPDLALGNGVEIGPDLLSLALLRRPRAASITSASDVSSALKAHGGRVLAPDGSSASRGDIAAAAYLAGPMGRLDAARMTRQQFGAYSLVALGVTAGLAGFGIGTTGETAATLATLGLGGAALGGSVVLSGASRRSMVNNYAEYGLRSGAHPRATIGLELGTVIHFRSEYRTASGWLDGVGISLGGDLLAFSSASGACFGLPMIGCDYQHPGAYHIDALFIKEGPAVGKRHLSFEAAAGPAMEGADGIFGLHTEWVGRLPLSDTFSASVGGSLTLWDSSDGPRLMAQPVIALEGHAGN